MHIDRTYFSRLLTLAVPITIQYFFTTALNAIDVVMIGQLGEVAVAGVGLANQITFLSNFLIFGITSGSAVFAAQYWGIRNISGMRKVLGAALVLSLGGSLLFSVFAIGFPRAALMIYTADPLVVDVGSRYLRIVAFSFPFLAVTLSFSAILRSSGEVRLPMLVSIIALGLKTILSYALIFGHLGLPELGIPGAAIGTLIARSLEALLLVSLSYARQTAAAARLSELIHFRRAFWKPFLVTALPVVGNEFFWAMGITTYNIIYARIGTAAVAAINITATIEDIAFPIFIGISNACGIMVGNRIGAGDEKTAYQYAVRSLKINVGIALLAGLLIYTISDPILSFYKVSPIVKEYAHNILFVISLTWWIRVSNMLIIVGILRSGGDTRFSLFLEIGTIWMVGIPMAAFGAFVLHLPVYYVYPLVMIEELTKLFIGIRRLISKKWINNLTKTSEEAAVPLIADA